MHSQCCHHLCQPFLSQTLRGTFNTNKNDQQLSIPPTQNRRLARRAQRHLSTNLGGGKCKWTAPNYEVPEDIDFHKTLIVGFPTGDKRVIFLQMEALVGWRKIPRSL